MIKEAKGKLIIFSAPSGAGKTTLVHHILNVFPDIEFSISACSRPKRSGEQHEKDYYFLSLVDFKKKIENNEFIEWQEVYKDNFYGTLKSEIERIWAMNKTVIFDVDVVGGLNLKKLFAEKALSVFVKAPSVEELERRLKSRQTESSEKIAIRIQKAKHEMAFEKEFDVALINIDLEHSLPEAEKLVRDFLAK
jgi:guanylate kinase